MLVEVQITNGRSNGLATTRSFRVRRFVMIDVVKILVDNPSRLYWEES